MDDFETQARLLSDRCRARQQLNPLGKTVSFGDLRWTACKKTVSASGVINNLRIRRRFGKQWLKNNLVRAFIPRDERACFISERHNACEVFKRHTVWIYIYSSSLCGSTPIPFKCGILEPPPQPPPKPLLLSLGVEGGPGVISRRRSLK